MLCLFPSFFQRKSDFSEIIVSLSSMFAASCFGKILKTHLQLSHAEVKERIFVSSSFGNLKIELLVLHWAVV